MADTVADDVRGLEETARFFDVTAPTVRRWIQDGCPVVERGGHGVAYKLSLRAVDAWRKDRDEREAKEQEERAARDAQLRLELLGGESMADEATMGLTPRQRAELYEEELKRLRLARERGDLVLADDMRAKAAEAFALIRERLRAIPDRLGREFARTDDEVEKCRAIIDDALTDLADALATGAEPADRERDAAAG